MLRILIVDDQNLMRQGLKILLESNQNIEIVGIADNGTNAIKQVEILRPDLVLIDVEMPKVDGLTATKTICKEFPETKVLVLSSHESEEYASQALKAGAYGYLLKNMLVEDLEQAIESVNRGYPQIEAKLLTKVIAESLDGQSTTKKKQVLTPDQQNKFTLETLHSKDQASDSDVPHSHTLVGGRNNKYQTNDAQIGSIENKDKPVIYATNNSSKYLDLVQPKQNYLPAINANDFMPPISLFTRLGGLFLVGSLGVLIILSAFTPYRVTVKAPSVIRPTGEIKLVQAETDGKIISIKVKENQTVKKGEIIATIDQSNLQTEINQLQTKIQQAYLQKKQINDQIIALHRQIEAEVNKNEGATAEAKAELNLNRRNYQDSQITTTAEVEEAQANLGLAQEESKQAQAELRSAEARLVSLLAALKAAQSKSNRYQIIENTGALSKNLLEEALLAVEQQKQEIAAQEATVEQQKRFVDGQNQAVEAAKARLQNVMVALAPSNAEVEIAQKRITQVQASGEATIASINRDTKAMIQQRIDIQKQLERDQQELKQMRKNLNQTMIKSPVSGTLFQSNLNNPGQIVQSGTEIAKVAPVDNSLMAKVLVDAKDIDKVDVKQTTQLKISACPYPDYGILKGSVKEISPDAFQPTSNSNSPSGEITKAIYEVKIELENTILKQGHKKCSLQLGMEGEASIISREETMLYFLLRKARLITDL